ncbi:imidazole glycerol phosphate synthase subunit HisF [Allobaculum mucilyticum]|uniref:imidazole glycerol phosphate synthase subunit HisF n=1 Tax=Allobaculum mucilyticum TaxID=2834459 RepID=UPI001E40D67A|nr:imidazole glycerol phosphate synthase subunit HisF [Allobaculum mucilyticum]UNT96515.1 imidazole glycerol phosphate synthase subunit HisF [Allobaculum mucilyticum]
MLTRRIIPCLDVRDGKVVKGINFVGIKEVGDPVELAKKYNDQRADELVFLDITATWQGRKTMVDTVRRVAEQVFIPLTVGGGISSIKEIRALLNSGADKVSLNSAALDHPELITEASRMYGSSCIVVAIDARKQPDGTWHCYKAGGRIDTGKDAVEWAKEAVAAGAGEILLTSMDADGTKQGFDLELCKAIRNAVHVPLIASGGCGSLDHFSEVFEEDAADAALAASLFHYDELSVLDVKNDLKRKGIRVR